LHSEEKREPVSDIDIAVADSLRELDLKRPIREADIPGGWANYRFMQRIEVGVMPQSRRLACGAELKHYETT